VVVSPDCKTTLTWWGSSFDAPSASVESTGPLLDTGDGEWPGASGAKSSAVKENTLKPAVSRDSQGRSDVFRGLGPRCPGKYRRSRPDVFRGLGPAALEQGNTASSDGAPSEGRRRVVGARVGERFSARVCWSPRQVRSWAGRCAFGQYLVRGAPRVALPAAMPPWSEVGDP